MNQSSVSDPRHADFNRVHEYMKRCASAITTALQGQSDQPARQPARQPALEGAAQLHSALRQAQPRQFTSRSVSVIDSLALIQRGMLIEEFKSISPFLPWKPSFRSDDGGRDMALASINDVFDLGDVTCGFIFVGAGCSYPEHQHEPQELYLTLSDGALWRFGGHDHYQSLDCGAVIYNKPWDLHGVRADGKPSLALYVLWPPTVST